MRGLFCAARAPDEKHHYHNDTSNYTVIRIRLRFAVVQGALPLDNVIQETVKAGGPLEALTLSLDATQLKSSMSNSRVFDSPCTILPALQVKGVKTSSTHVTMEECISEGFLVIVGISTISCSKFHSSSAKGHEFYCGMYQSNYLHTTE